MQINRDTDALIVVDMQRDFITGSLAVPNAAQIIGPISNLMLCFKHVIATQDWHPPEHTSFASRWGAEPFVTSKAEGGILWPDHCIANSHGSELVLHHQAEREIKTIIRKGWDKEVDSYSAFYDDNDESSGLDGMLDRLGIERVFVCGLALDFCVYSTAKDAYTDGYRTFIIQDMTRAVNPEKNICRRKA